MTKKFRGWFIVAAIAVFCAGLAYGALNPRPLLTETPPHLEDAVRAEPLEPNPAGHDAP